MEADPALELRAGKKKRNPASLFFYFFLHVLVRFQLKSCGGEITAAFRALYPNARPMATPVEDIVKELDEETVALLVDKMALFDVSKKF